MSERLAARVLALVCTGAMLFAPNLTAGAPAPVNDAVVEAPQDAMVVVVPDAVVVTPQDAMVVVVPDATVVALDATLPPDATPSPDAEVCQLCADDRENWDDEDGPEGDACDSSVTDNVTCEPAGLCGAEGCSITCCNHDSGVTWSECTVVNPECEGCNESGDAGVGLPPDSLSDGWIAQAGLGRILGRPRRASVGTFTTGAGVERPHWGHFSMRFDELPSGACTTRAQLHSRARRALGIADDDPCITLHEEIRYNPERGVVTECRIHVYAVARLDHATNHGTYHALIDGHRRGGMWLLANRVPEEMFLRRRTTRPPPGGGMEKPDETEVEVGTVCNGPNCGACESCCVESEEGIEAAEGGCDLFCLKNPSCDAGCVGANSCGATMSGAREVRPATSSCSCRTGPGEEGGVVAGAALLLLFCAALRSRRGRRMP